jgi:hypothetical protein
MKTQINEIKRMQQLAGLINESQILSEGIKLDILMKDGKPNSEILVVPNRFYGSEEELRGATLRAKEIKKEEGRKDMMIFSNVGGGLRGDQQYPIEGDEVIDIITYDEARKKIKESQLNELFGSSNKETTPPEIEQYIKNGSKGNLDLRGTGVTSLGNLKSVGGNILNFTDSKLASLGNLETVGGSLLIGDSPLTSLGNLKSVGEDAALGNTKITSLGNLKSVGGDLMLFGTPIAEKFNEEQIRKMVNVKGEVKLNSQPQQESFDQLDEIVDKVLAKLRKK